MSLHPELELEIDRLTKTYADELVAFRRDLHANPEPGREEFRTTERVAERLHQAGLASTAMPTGTGLFCDIDGAPPPVGPQPVDVDHRISTAAATAPSVVPPAAAGAASVTTVGQPHPGRVALRADLDALRLTDEKDVPYHSTRSGVCHACGHDVHTSIMLGAGLVLADLRRAGLLDRDVRLLFQPAEEIIPGGALDVVAADGLDGVDHIFALHCDPRIEAGQVGLRTGAITAAADRVHLRVSGPGGHTARPHLTADLVYALSALATKLPAALARRVDPRAGLSLVWGRIDAGSAANVIPMHGELEGTLRCLDSGVWEQSAALVPDVARAIAEPFGVELEVDVHRGVPPVDNDAAAIETLRAAADRLLGPGAATTTEQSMGGEDFAWYLTKVPGAMGRLGVRTPGATPGDIHQGTFDVDERAIGVGVRLMVAAALLSPHGRA